MKILINTTYGGFKFDPAACDMYIKLTGMPIETTDMVNISEMRTDPIMIQILEDNPMLLGSLKPVEIPDDINWHVDTYYGKEIIAESLRKWM